MLKRFPSWFCLLIPACLVSPSAEAVTLTYQFANPAVTYDLNNTDPGLVVQTTTLVNPGDSFALDNGQSETFDLFTIWTDETSINPDDEVLKSIDVTLHFSSPPVAGSDAPVDGSTAGFTAGFLGAIQGGYLTWNGSTTVTHAQGEYLVTLTGGVFNKGIFWGTVEGEKHGLVVKATVKQISGVAPVPEPGTLAMAGVTGLLGLGYLASQRRRQA